MAATGSGGAHLRPRMVAGLAGTTACAVAVAGVLVGPAPSWAGDGKAWVPPDDTVVLVRGTARGGFTVAHVDRTVMHLPTLSEARSECAAYDRRVRRVRCWTEVKTWYRDLGDLKRSLRYVRQQARSR